MSSPATTACHAPPTNRSRVPATGRVTTRTALNGLLSASAKVPKSATSRAEGTDATTLRLSSVDVGARFAGLAAVTLVHEHPAHGSGRKITANKLLDVTMSAPNDTENELSES